ncbi:MAG: hypothetical protein HYS18_00540 [Burkholderiales bacterium]|nr:hypothetical protein [Burkholderiales bacterium]
MVVTLAALVAACKPSEPPPDLVKTQREALEKAKAVEGQVLQAAQEQKRAIEAAEAGKAADTGK